MILYLYGTDTKRSREHLDKLIEKFYRERDPQRLNVKRVVVGANESTDIRSELLTAPFLAPKRIVVVERMLELGDAELLTWFAVRFLDNEPPEDTIIVLWEEEPVKKSKNSNEALHARLTQGKFAQEFAAFEGKNRVDFIVREVAARGATITNSAADSLSRRVANNFELSNLIEMLTAYVGAARPINDKDLDIFLTPDIENTIFAAMDELAQGKKKHAMELLAQVWYVDNDPVYVFAMLHRQARLMFEAHDLIADNPALHEETAAAKMGVHPFVGKKIIGAARRAARADLVLWYDRLIDIDYAIKHGSADPRMLIDKFVAA